MGEITNRDAILNKVSVLFEKMHQNQKLQQLAEQNNLDIKNTIKLTDDNMMNVAVTLVALSLAKEANDPRYKKLVNTGLQKRSLKLEIINDYKKEANDIIKDYSSGNFNKEPIQEGFLDIFKPKTTGDNSIKHYYITTTDEMNDVEQNFKLKFPEDFKKGYGDLYDKIGDKTINCKIDNSNRTGKLSKELILTGNENVIIIFDMDEDYIGLDTSTGKYYLNPVMKNDSDMGELMFNNFKEFKKFIEGLTDSDEAVQEGYNDFTDETSDEIKSFISKELVKVYDNWTSADVRALVHPKAYCIEVFFVKGKTREQCYDLCDRDVIDEDKLMDAFKNIAHKIRTTDEYKESCEYKKCFNVENSESVQEGFLDIFKSKPKESPKPKRVPQNLDDVADMIGLKDAGFDFPEDFKKGYESEAFKKLLEDPDFYVQGEIKCWPNSDIQGKKNIWKISILDYKHLESWNSSNGETGVVIVCGVRNDEWVALNCEDGKYYLCASSTNECDSNNLMFTNFREFSKFLNGKHFSKEEINKLRNDDSYEINDY